MTPPIAPVLPHRPSGPARAIQGSFPGGRPRFPQASSAIQPARPGPARPGAAGPLKPSPAIVPGAPRPSAVQPSGGNAFALPPGFQLRPSALGQRLPDAVREKMESFFGASFADVRVHVGNEAASIGALAFTIGTDLYFAPGQYNPQTVAGQQLLGHELTHVVQQRAGRVRNPMGSGMAVVQDPALEAEAERMGQRAASATVPLQAKLAPACPAAPAGPAPGRAAILPRLAGPAGGAGAGRAHPSPGIAGPGPVGRPVGVGAILPMIKAGKKAKSKKKGAKGGVECYLNGSKKPIPQGSNSDANQHAERNAVRLALSKSKTADIELVQNAWPCSECDQWLRNQAAEHGITITVEVTGDHGGYSQDHGEDYGAVGTLTYP